MGEKLDYQGYPVTPRQLGKNAWFYIERTGLMVLVHSQSSTTLSAKIPWRQLRAAMRYDKRTKPGAAS